MGKWKGQLLQGILANLLAFHLTNMKCLKLAASFVEATEG